LKRRDPKRFAREYLAEFAEDLTAFLTTKWVDDVVVSGRYELPPRPGVQYVAAVDASGGGRDAFTLAIVHTEFEGENGKLVQDVMRSYRQTGSEKVDLEGVVTDFADVLKRYRVKEITGDAYAAGWAQQAFTRCGIAYLKAPFDASRAYVESGPLFSGGEIEILDHEVLIRELKNLEARPRAGGQLRVSHPSGASYHDDHANALCLAAAVVITAPVVEQHEACFIIDGVEL
jgi:hypothetical protein